MVSVELYQYGLICHVRTITTFKKTGKYYLKTQILYD